MDYKLSFFINDMEVGTVTKVTFRTAEPTLMPYSPVEVIELHRDFGLSINVPTSRAKRQAIHGLSAHPLLCQFPELPSLREYGPGVAIMGWYTRLCRFAEHHRIMVLP